MNKHGHTDASWRIEERKLRSAIREAIKLIEEHDNEHGNDEHLDAAMILLRQALG